LGTELTAEDRQRKDLLELICTGDRNCGLWVIIKTFKFPFWQVVESRYNNVVTVAKLFVVQFVVISTSIDNHTIS